MPFARIVRAAVLLAVPSILALALVLPDLLAQPAKPGRKVAILVAVQDYSGTGLSNLKYCENDVNELAKVLKAQGYADDDIHLLTSSAAFDRKKENLFPTAENVRKWLGGMVEDLRAEDTILIAFSGHGVHLKELKETGLHFCPKGANLRKPETLVSLAEVYEQLEKNCKASVKLLVVDACRNDPTDGRAAGDARLASQTRPLVPDPPGGTVAFFSCSTGQIAYESDALRHGIFFHHFIQGLKGGPTDAPIAKDGEVTVPLLEDYLTRVVPVAVKKDKGDPTLKQTPERKGSIRGQVVLAKVAVAKVAVAKMPREPESETKVSDTATSVGPKLGFDMYPATLTTRWTYLVNNEEILVTAAAREKLNGEEVVRFDTAKDGTVKSSEWIAFRTDGAYRVKVNSELVDPPVLILPSMIKKGTAWKIDSSVGGSKVRGEYKISDERISVKVPAGTFEAVLVEGEVDVAGSSTRIRLWFVPGRGMTKVSYAISGNETVMELKEFRAAK